jgi:hypothetical protein
MKDTIYVHQFGAFSSKGGYNEIAPSTKYLISLIKKTLRPWYNNRVSLFSAEHLKIDHSHIRFTILSGLFTAMNENNQIRLQNFVFSKSQRQIVIVLDAEWNAIGDYVWFK